MNDFKAIPAELRQAIMDAVKRVIDSGYYILGKEVIDFECEWAKTCGTGFAIGVGNGLDAIEIALRVLNIGPGEEVITTPMTAFASVLAIMRAGAIPVLADIIPETALMDTESVRRCISDKTRAVLLVHIYGQVCHMDEWNGICRERGIALIEDCAQAHGATWQRKVAGSFGSIGAYSFYPTKNLGSLGDAGALVTNDSDLANKARCLRNYGQSIRYYHPVIGMNSRMDEIQAAILSEQLKWLPQFTERRRMIASAFRTGIKNPRVRLLAEPEERESHVYHLFVVACDDRDELQRHMNMKGVQTLVHYPVPIHHQEPCLSIKKDPLGLFRSEAHAKTCLSIPCNPQLTDSDLEIVIDAVNSF